MHQGLPNQVDNTGVFVGISYNEYAQLSAAASSTVSTFTATGGNLSVAAGPSISVSSLNLAESTAVCVLG